jgi:hypothetical protein
MFIVTSLMPIYDPKYARNTILRRFNNPPRLSFDGPGHIDLLYSFPRLRKPRHVVDKAEGKKIPESLRQLNECIKHGTSKFEYGRTSTEEWKRYFRFPSDQLSIVKGIKRVSIFASRYGENGCINSTRDRAHSWFLRELVPAISAERDRARTIVLGDPGCGKSTLLKYLINSHWDHLVSEKICISRFEFMKFFEFWHKRKPVRRSFYDVFDDYISYILLRDVISFFGYRLVGGNKWVKLDVGPLASGRLQETVAAALDEFSSVAQIKSRGKPDAILAGQVAKAMREDGLNLAALRDISPKLRLPIIRYLLRQRGFALSIVMDGLDALAMEDMCFDTERAAVIHEIQKNLSAIGAFRSLFDLDVGLAPHLILVMRENSYFVHGRPRSADVRLVEPRVYRVAKIDERVAALNVVQRSVERWGGMNHKGRRAQNGITHLLMRAMDTVVRVIARSVGFRISPEFVYALFCGNIRHVFEFMKSLLSWFVEQGQREEVLILRQHKTLESILRELGGSGGLRLLKRRKYRLIEILLLNRMPWFENAIYVERDPFLARVRANEPPLKDSALHTGFVDNIFNYHVQVHENHPDAHCLLEKIRIVQLLGEQELNSTQLRLRLLSKFGFEIPLERLSQIVLPILLRTQMIAARMQGDEGYLYATDRGKFVVNHLCCELSYIEHVFHETLLPDLLVQRINDEWRDASVNLWAARSIRNSFLFLTYLKAVESHPARRRKVPQQFQIWPRAVERVSRSVARILMDNELRLARPSRRRRGGVSLASEVLTLIENDIKRWDALSLVAQKYA